MADVSEFYGIRNTNLRQRELFSREMFPRSLAVALVNYMGDKKIPLNYVTIGKDRSCRVSELDVCEIFGGESAGNLRFDFGTVNDPWEDLAENVPRSELVVRNGLGVPICGLDLKTSVIPDAATKGLPEHRMGPEITVKTDSLKACALSIASSLASRSEEAVRILEKGVPFDVEWSDWTEVSKHLDDIMCNLDVLESEMFDLQRPFMIQAIWKTEADGPFMTDNALDAFVWSDFAITRLFFDSGKGVKGDKPTRPQRCAIRLYLIITSILRGENPDLDDIVAETDYGLGGSKEFMVNGKTTNRAMFCKRLVEPRVSALETTFLMSYGSEHMFVPERSLEMSIYCAMRAHRS